MRRTFWHACLGFALAVQAGVVEAAQTNAPAPTGSTAIDTQVIADGLAGPWALEFLPDGRMLVSERPGQLRIVSKTGAIGQPIAGVPAVRFNGQGGLLDVALAPDYETSNIIYLSFSEARDGDTAGTSVAKARLKLDGNGGALENVEIIFRQSPSWKGGYHFGSRLAFDGNGDLFITTGERNFARGEAQNPANHIGKIIQIHPDGTAVGAQPKHRGWDSKVWSIGHRNVQGAAIDPVTGSLWTVEHGARGGDELNRPEAGKNYGWPVITYGRDYTFLPIGEGTEKAGLEQPVYYWDPSIATSSLAIYSGDLFANWRGNFLVTGLKGAHLARLVVADGQVIAEQKLLEDFGERLRDVKVDRDGAIWVVTDDPSDGKLVRITPRT